MFYRISHVLLFGCSLALWSISPEPGVAAGFPQDADVEREIDIFDLVEAATEDATTEDPGNDFVGGDEETTIDEETTADVAVTTDEEEDEEETGDGEVSEVIAAAAEGLVPADDEIPFSEEEFDEAF
ncbi:MAG: hypothetical protein Q4C47_08305, partial [Planctomycetia bacterium]|nr:hypothetical protein [Planctomycetia bacterium]